MVELFANNGDPDQTSRFAASAMGLHCLPVTSLGSPVFNRLIVMQLEICIRSMLGRHRKAHINVFINTMMKQRSKLSPRNLIRAFTVCQQNNWMLQNVLIENKGFEHA